jgi:hypothetical protein
VTGTLAYVFVAVAVICVIAGVTAVARTRRATRDDVSADGESYGEATYAEEAAAVAAAQQAAAAAYDASEDEPQADLDIDVEGPLT